MSGPIHPSTAIHRLTAPAPGAGLDKAATARLLVAGDTHGNQRWVATLAKLARRHGCAGILQLGDFGVWPGPGGVRYLDQVEAHLVANGIWMVFIDGNHEDHDALDRARFAHRHAGGEGFVALRPHLAWAPRGLRWSWCGTRFGALGGAFSIDWQGRTPGQSWWPQEVTTEADVEALGEAPLDVLVCHDAPAGFAIASHYSIDPNDHARSYEVRMRLAEAVAATRPELILHGHWHRRITATLAAPDAPASEAAGEMVWAASRVEGLASDQEGDQRSWGILELPSLGFVPGNLAALPGQALADDPPTA